jgi:hypothetical protein
VVSFQRIGPKVLLVQGNESFRSSSSNPAERRSVEDSFAKSVLWGFTVAAESNGHVLVDASDFFLRDGQGAANALRPGTYRVDRTRSAFYMERTKAFPKNSEIEVTLTFANEPPADAAAVAADPHKDLRRSARAAVERQAGAAADSFPAPWPASLRWPKR